MLFHKWLYSIYTDCFLDSSGSADGFNSSLPFEFLLRSHKLSQNPEVGLLCFHARNQLNQAGKHTRACLNRTKQVRCESTLKLSCRITVSCCFALSRPAWTPARKMNFTWWRWKDKTQRARKSRQHWFHLSPPPCQA